MLTLDDAVALATALPEVTEGTRYRRRAWFVHGKAFTWERPLGKADLARLAGARAPVGAVLALLTADLGEKESVLASGTPGFFTIEHLDGHPIVLVELGRTTAEAVREGLLDAWLAAAPPELARRELGL